ncbi:DUF1793-domain-containing protein [Pluteus cervinus]|uniref:DUF1793-domain-containing protein n=1 Tax=Pluteus cervinus TaxID=181527 RepID=A0ACD3BDW1_9AGAR|nr:DUF1793-domain-containing protein [Pluteus cervinus]
MNLFACLSALLLLRSALAAPSWSATPILPGSIPLAVRTPYLSAWLPQGGGQALNDVWPQFWTGSALGWTGFVNVDGASYTFLGNPNAPHSQKAVQKSFEYTATRSIFVLSAGAVDVTVTFLSPVEPANLLVQSIPFAYMTVSVASTDGRSHDVSIYSDISAEWVSGDDNLAVTWGTYQLNQIVHEIQLNAQQPFTEVNDHIQHGSAYYAIENDGDVTFQTGADQDVRNQFALNGRLANTQDTNFRAINNNWPVFALSKHLGTVGSSAVPTTFAIGHIRDPLIEYVVAGGTVEQRSSYFWSQLNSPASVIDYLFQVYPASVKAADQFDAKIKADSLKISANYAAITTLSVRQAFGATEISIRKDSHGNYDTNSTLVFMKEISSDGNVNTVDVIFPAWPVFLYTSPVYGKYLLDALLQYVATGLYPNKWTVHDLGSSYPRALGHNDGNDEAMPVEESGNILIMALSYTQKSKDLSFIKTNFQYLDQWTQFLIQDSLIPELQISSDDFAGHLANQTNLAVKGIIGIRAMAEIANLVGDTARRANYTSIAASYVQKWQGFATAASRQHLTLAYGQDSTWGLAYNLFGDKLLGLNLFPQSVYQMQNDWYKAVINPFGVPLDTRNTFTKSDWTIFTAAIATEPAVRDSLVSAVVNFIGGGHTDAPFPDLYETGDGRAYGFRARPVVGGHLALLALM